MRKRLAALAVLCLAAHVSLLPPTLEDIDSINFAMGVRDFDVARHQPHPPGYPVFIALGKVSTAALRALDVSAAAARGLAIWSAIAGAALVPLLFLFFRSLHGDPARAWWAAGITVASPLFWFSALRPLSDMAGLAAAVAAQALFVQVLLRHGATLSPARALQLGALIAGLAVGLRSQTAVLTMPLLVAALAWPARAVPARDRVLASAAAVAGILTWAVPLVFASGGPEAYLRALGSQAGEDFSGVAMLWTTRSPRAVLDAAAHSFLWPWGGVVIGSAVVALALAGGARFGIRDPRGLAVLGLAFGPYAVFHLLFQETVTTRYALPLVPAAACLVVQALAGLGRAALHLGGAALATASLVVAMPAARAYSETGSPTLRLLEDVSSVASDDRTWPDDVRVIGMHAVTRRAQQWLGEAPTPSLRASHGYEWLALVEHWRKQPSSSALFVADPRRTDLALFDPHARQLIDAYRWRMPVLPYVGGVRPGDADLYVMRPPGWMLDRGWALTAEVAGVSARDGTRPHAQPCVAWVRARGGPALLAVGGRHLGQTGDRTARLTVSRDATVLDAWTASPGFFFRRIALPPRSLAGDGYIPLHVSASVDGPAGQVRVALEQFDLQPDGAVMWGFEDGWQEPEYSRLTARAWRWMSERAALWVRPVGRDLTLTVRGESPLRYFDRPPSVRISVGGRELGRFTPMADFMLSVLLPADLIAAAEGRVSIESDRWFSPADRGGSADRRRLALRVYSVKVSP